MAILRVKGIRSWSPRSYTLTHHTKGGTEVLCGHHYNIIMLYFTAGHQRIMLLTMKTL